ARFPARRAARGKTARHLPVRRRPGTPPQAGMGPTIRSTDPHLESLKLEFPEARASLFASPRQIACRTSLCKAAPRLRLPETSLIRPRRHRAALEAKRWRCG